MMRDNDAKFAEIDLISPYFTVGRCRCMWDRTIDNGELQVAGRTGLGLTLVEGG